MKPGGTEVRLQILTDHLLKLLILLGVANMLAATLKMDLHGSFLVLL